LKRNFPNLKDVKVTLIEALPHILNVLDKQVIDYVEDQFKQSKNIQVLTRTQVTRVAEREIRVKDLATGKEMTVPYGVLVWATGNAPRKLIQDLIKTLGPQHQTARMGLTIDKHFQVRGAPFLWALGDCAPTIGLPATAQVASQEGAYMGRMFNRLADQMMDWKLSGVAPELIDKALSEVPEFEFRNRGFFAYVGSSHAVGDVPTHPNAGTEKHHVLHGLWVYWLWRSVYFTKLLSIRNRVFFVFDWLSTTAFGRDITRSGSV